MIVEAVLKFEVNTTTRKGKNLIKRLKMEFIEFTEEVKTKEFAEEIFQDTKEIINPSLEVKFYEPLI